MELQSKCVFIFGYSGHSYVVIESLLDAGYCIKGYFDYQKSAKNPYELEYFGFEKDVDAKKIVGDNLVFPTVGDNMLRKNLVEFFVDFKFNQFVAIDPSANVSKTAKLNVSTYIGKNVTVNAQSVIGKGVILNTSCIVEHECNVSDYVHLAPGCVLCGNVVVEKNCFLGANTVVRQNIKISKKNFIGAGSVVTHDLVERGVWVGNKLRKL